MLFLPRTSWERGGGGRGRALYPVVGRGLELFGAGLYSLQAPGNNSTPFPPPVPRNRDRQRPTTF